MTPDEFDTMLHDAEVKLARLRALYEQYFQGIEKLEPHIPRKDLERTFEILRKGQPRNTALRFRLQQTIARYGTYVTYWQRIARQIEEGTYRRDLQKLRERNLGRLAEMKAEKPEPSAWEIDIELETPDDDTPDTVSIGHRASDIDAILESLTAGGRERGLGPASSAAPAARSATAAPPAGAGKPVAPRGLSPLIAFGKPTVAPKAAPAPITPPGAAPPAPMTFAKPDPAALRMTPTPTLGTPRTTPTPTIGTPARAGTPAPAAPNPGIVTRSAGTPAPAAPSPGLVARPVATPAVVARPATPSPVVARPAVTPAAAARPVVAPVQPAARPAVAPSPSANLDDRAMRSIYERYADARRKNNEGDVRFETLQKSVEQMMPKLREKHGGKKIDFDVVVANGRVGLKPKIGE